MDRVANPDLLARGKASPHDYRLRASQQQLLAEADLVIWAGDGLDDFMADAMANLPPTARVIKVTDLDLPVRLPPRTTGLWRKDGPSGDGQVDPYVWLDTVNAVAIAEAIARALIDLDREHKINYVRNRDTVSARLGGLDRQLRRALEPFKGVPFIVQNDAFQYLERRYGLDFVGALETGHDGGTASDDHLAELIEEAEILGIACVLAQPQFDRAAVDSFAADAGVEIVDMDPLYADQRGVNAYFEMMRTLPKALAACS